MINDVVVKKLEKFKDDRGWLLEAFRSDELPQGVLPAMSYVSMTKPGVVRGPHEHKDQTDIFVFIGPGTFELHLWDNRKDSSTFGNFEKHKVGEDNLMVVVVPPGVVHGYKNVSDKEAWCLNYPDQLYAGKGKKEEVDEIRHENDTDSKFKI
ncbi:MAG: dTDP-4-dehydrorhamnose 3,5-epimerase family protein [Patescibacteria group bacterium]|nr:dTDP-4-dehydrorhamnose 3,5-epimerase family protein [Patescibacteria group bacterium]